jgi:hypothetical protein
VALRLLYLIFLHLLNLLMMLGCSSAPKDIGLLVLRHEVACYAGPPGSLAWIGPIARRSPRWSEGCRTYSFRVNATQPLHHRGGRCKGHRRDPS